MVQSAPFSLLMLPLALPSTPTNTGLAHNLLLSTSEQPETASSIGRRGATRREGEGKGGIMVESETSSEPCILSMGRQLKSIAVVSRSAADVYSVAQFCLQQPC